jgi:Pyridoxamine 5'-phosphate oxidase
VLDAEAAAPFHSGCSLIVATVDAQGQPDANRAWSILVSDGGARLRVTIAADQVRVQENLRATGVLAITATDVATLVSVQAKGRAEPVEFVSETETDRLRREAHIDDFVRIVHATDGSAVELINRLRPDTFSVFEMKVEEVFDQTPGPAAGRQLAPVR